MLHLNKFCSKTTVFILFLSVLFTALPFCAQSFANENPSKKIIENIKTNEHKQLFRVPLFLIIKPNFNFIKTHSGYVDENKKITLDVAELQLPYKTLLKEFNPISLKKKGLELKSRNELLWNGSNVTLFKLFQATEHSVVGKWVFILDKGDSSWMVTSSYDSKNQNHAAAVLEMINSIYWEDGQSESFDNINANNVGTQEKEFEFAGISQGALVYSKDGSLPTKSPDEALFIVSKSKNSQNLTPNKYLSYAKNKIKSIEPNKKLKIVSEDEVNINGLQGIKLIANTQEKNVEENGLLFLTILFDVKKIHTLVGIAKKDVAKNLELFNSLSLSYRHET